MFTVSAVLWCSDSSDEAITRTPEEAGLAVEAGISVALLQFFRNVDVASVIVEYRQLPMRRGFIVESIFHADECTPLLPDTLELAERVLERRVSQVLYQVFGVESVAQVRLSRVAPRGEWDDVLEDIA